MTIIGGDYVMVELGPFCEHLLIMSGSDTYCLRCAKLVKL